MKKLLVVLACAGALVIVGCGDKDTPETFGKKYIEKKFENINCDLEDLDYTIVEESDDAATVLIEGKIKYKEEIQLVNKDGKWVIGEKEAKKEEAKAEPKAEKKETHAAPVKKAEEPKAESHAAPAAHDAHAPAAHH